MTEWTDDSRDEPADDHHDESEESDETADEPSGPDAADRHEAGDVADGSEETGDAADGTDESDATPTDDRVGGTDPDRDDDRDRRPVPRPRDPHPHSVAADSESEGDNHWLSSLIDALERLEGGSSSGQRRSDRTVLDYDISIGTPFDSDGDPSDSAIESSSIDDRPGGESSRDRPRKRRRRSTASGSHHLTTRASDDELLVTADVGGTDPDDVTVGFDDGTLVVAVSGNELDRVDVPWADRSADATIKNGILTVEVTPGSGSTEEVTDDE